MPGLTAVNNVGILIKAEAETGAITATTVKLDEMGVAAEKNGAKSALSMASFGSSVGAAGKQMKAMGDALLPASVAIAAIGGYSIKSAMDFESAMTEIQTQAGASAGEVKKMTGAVLDMSTQVGQKPQELAKGLFFVESAGFRGAAALDVLKLASEGAQVGGANLADTTRALTGVMNSHIIGAQNATEAMGNLNAIVGAGAMHYQELNDAIGTGFFGAAAAFGVSLQSAGAAVADLTRLGMPAVDAATRLRMSMTLMAEPTAKAQKVLQAAGFSINDISTNSASMTAALDKAHVKTSDMAADLQKPNGFLVAINDMKDHLEKAGIKGADAAAVISSAFGGGRSSGPILQMIKDTTGLSNTYDTLNGHSKKFADDWAARQKDTQFKWDQFKATLQKDAITIGQELLPKVTNALGTISRTIDDVTKWWNKLSPPAKSAISDIALALAVGAPLLIGLAKVITAIQTIGTTFLTLGKPLAQAGVWIAKFAADGIASIYSIGAETTVVRGIVMAPMVMGGISVAAALASLGLVLAAANTVINTINVVKSMNAGMAADRASSNAAIGQMEALTQSPDAGQRNRARTALHNLHVPGYATGTNYARGGWATVGENGPEKMYVPQGAQIKSNGQSSAMKGGDTNTQTVNIGTIVLSSAGAVSSFFKKIDQDTLLVHKGLTPNRGGI